MSYNDIVADFEFLDEWEDRYRYVIELGRSLDPLSENAHNETNKVHGCVSQVWLQTSVEQNPDGSPLLHFKGDSDAHIVSGLVAIMLSLFSGQTASKIIEIDANAALKQLGLDEALTPQRSNGLASMIERIKSDAQNALT
ncbi:MAG: SufE family protein [bacterium]|nr:SufE family protein [bacterium]